MLIRSCAVQREKPSETSDVFWEEVNRNDCLKRSFDINGFPQTCSNSSGFPLVQNDIDLRAHRHKEINSYTLSETKFK
jgi:hypothetical protein